MSYKQLQVTRRSQKFTKEKFDPHRQPSLLLRSNESDQITWKRCWLSPAAMKWQDTLKTMVVLTPFSGAWCRTLYCCNALLLITVILRAHIQDTTFRMTTPPPQIGNSRPTNSTPCRRKNQETECQGFEHHGSGVNNPSSLTSLFGDFSPANLPLNYHPPWSWRYFWVPNNPSCDLKP